MMSKQKAILSWFLFFLVITGVSFFLTSWMIPKESGRLEQTVSKQTKATNQKKTIHYVAIGDSLTQGVGDETKQGGFVSLVADKIKDNYQLKAVHAQNEGVAGERSDQILKRINQNTSLQKEISQADFLTATFGGNDLLKVIEKNFLSLSVKKIEKSETAYQKNSEALLARLRELNPTAPIYVLGIYNPFYLNFSEITALQTVVDNWNDATEQVVKEQKNMYFIPINDLLYKGLNSQVGVTKSTTSDSQSSSSAATSNSIENNALYEGDKFHPNSIGYQIMAKAVRNELIATKSHWLIKE